MRKDCEGCMPRSDSHLCAIHSRAYSMRDLLQELSDAYLERAAAVISKTPETDQARLPKAMAKVPVLLAMIGREEQKEGSGP